MPNRDGTGPRGLGPMTGRQLGNCSNRGRNQYYGRGFGYRRGFGGGFGFGRGWGAGYNRGYGFPTEELPTDYEEKKILESDIRALKDQLKAMEKRLSEFENEN